MYVLWIFPTTFWLDARLPVSSQHTIPTLPILIGISDFERNLVRVLCIGLVACISCAFNQYAAAVACVSWRTSYKAAASKSSSTVLYTTSLCVSHSAAPCCHYYKAMFHNCAHLCSTYVRRFFVLFGLGFVYVNSVKMISCDL